jgi:hypothetical protein
VLAKNASIADASPMLWQEIEQQIIAADYLEDE